VGELELARLDAKRSARRGAAAGLLAERAFREHVVGLSCPSRWVELTTCYVESRPKPPVAQALLLLCLSLARDWDELVDGGWLGLVSAHRAVHFQGRGYGDARTFELLGSFFRWLHEDGRIDALQFDLLLAAIVDVRQGAGLARRHGPRVRDGLVWEHALDALVARFAATLADPFLEEMAPLSLDLLALHLGRGTSAVRFGRLRVAPFVERLLTPRTPHPLRDVVGFSRTVLDIASRFYRFLAEEAYLEHDLSARLASELGLSAIRLAVPDSAGADRPS
jgi:hypothetical protein